MIRKFFKMATFLKKHIESNLISHVLLLNSIHLAHACEVFSSHLLSRKSLKMHEKVCPNFDWPCTTIIHTHCTNFLTFPNPFRSNVMLLIQTNLSSAHVLTQTGLDDLYGAVVVLDGLVVLVHVAQGGGYMVVSLCQQATVCRQVLQLQSQTLLEVFQCLWVVACWQKKWKRKKKNNLALLLHAIVT